MGIRADFECPKCGVVLEADISDASPRCLECRVDMLRKYGVSGIVFRGSGFVKNDRN